MELGHETNPQKKVGIENRRLRFRRYKTLPHRNRHHQIHVKSSPYPGDHHPCHGLHQEVMPSGGF